MSWPLLIANVHFGCHASGPVGCLGPLTSVLLVLSFVTAFSVSEGRQAVDLGQGKARLLARFDPVSAFLLQVPAGSRSASPLAFRGSSPLRPPRSPSPELDAEFGSRPESPIELCRESKKDRMEDVDFNTSLVQLAPFRSTRC